MKTGSTRSALRSTRWPGPLYLDASALVKIYLPEPASDDLDNALVGRDDLIVSDLAVTEVTSAIARRRRAGAVSAEAAAQLHRAILEDVASGVLRRVDLVPDVHRTAERLLISILSVPLRAADSLHLALAIAAGTATVVTFDERMAAAAPAIGMNAAPA